MKFSEYLENLQELLRDRPELVDVEVVYSIVDEDKDNDFNVVNWGPIPGNYHDSRKNFVSEDDIFDDESRLPINAILIN